ncbi:TonB family protein [Herbaspirillum sp. SJZ099]|uniref:TonB family protein n=1 Tax=Herbaspirillum sp. SJZ099 TaxID=2572916 RepID=UPI0011A12F44|nr:TonB family protein [Herbaspirillum sp. SJZ099]TWC68568.1 outer membrane transport energization protein TonB [Herbaspirillum sp. SJZ099]
MRTPFLFRFRESLASLPSLLVLLALVLAGVQQSTRLKRHEDPTPMQIALFEEALPAPKIETPPPPEPPKKVEPPKPQAKPVPASKPTPAPPTQERPLTQAPAPLAALPPAVASTAPASAPAPAATPQPAAPQPAPAPQPNTANAESQYVAKLRAHLNSIKRYPTGREASQLRPQGKVRVWFVLKRDGSVVDLGIDESSNSMLLDDAARKTINRAAFAAFPEGSWSGENTHRFTADLEFIPVSG